MSASPFILGTLSVIFLYDTLAYIYGGNQATISYAFYGWLHTGWQAIAIFVAAFVLLFVHFWTDGRNTPKS